MDRRLEVLSSSQAMVLDAYYAETFVIELNGNISQIRVKNVVPGRLYVFIVKMDNTGGHTIKWGTQMLNASSVYLRGKSVSVFCFIGSTGGYLRPNAPGTWRL
jgi:hypothetical protein